MLIVRRTRGVASANPGISFRCTILVSKNNLHKLNNKIKNFKFLRDDLQGSDIYRKLNEKLSRYRLLDNR